MNTENDDLFKAFDRELEVIQDNHFELRTTMFAAWCLASEVQLALRHPQNTGPTAKIARDLACKIFETIAPDPESALAKVAAMGWDKKFDI